MATAPGYSVPTDVVEGFIANAAKQRGIDPNVALEVYRREGAGGWQSGVVKNGVREPSYGPFQLYTGGGLGNKFQQQTGLNPADPNTWQQNINFALDQAKQGGWGPWYGAKAAGITGFQGIGSAGVQPQPSQGFPQQTAPQQTQQPAQAPQQSAPQSPFNFALQGQQAPQQMPQQYAQQQMPQQAPEPERPINVTGLLKLLQNAPPSVRGLLLQG